MDQSTVTSSVCSGIGASGRHRMLKLAATFVRCVYPAACTLRKSSVAIALVGASTAYASASASTQHSQDSASGVRSLETSALAPIRSFTRFTLSLPLALARRHSRHAELLSLDTVKP